MKEREQVALSLCCVSANVCVSAAAYRHKNICQLHSHTHTHIDTHMYVYTQCYEYICTHLKRPQQERDLIIAAKPRLYFLLKKAYNMGLMHELDEPSH